LRVSAKFLQPLVEQVHGAIDVKRVGRSYDQMDLSSKQIVLSGPVLRDKVRQIIVVMPKPRRIRMHYTSYSIE
jgi:hypothetical protein